MTDAFRIELAATVGAIARAEPIPGGDINEAWCVELAHGHRLFVKTHASPPHGMYAAEAVGLAWIGEGPLRVPRVIAAGESFLALEWMDLAARGGGPFDA